MIEFQFDRTTQRYRYKDSGKFLSKSAMESLTKKAIAQVKTDLDTVNRLLIDRKISVAAWEEQTRNGLRRLHTWQYFLGLGGEANSIPSDVTILNERVRKEFQYLRGFATRINNGELSEAQFLYQANLYVNSTTNTYQLATYKSHSRAGYRWERRIRTKTESCTECLYYELLGWRTIGNLPQPGQECSCRANCGCFKEFSRSDLIPSDAGFTLSAALASKNRLSRGWGFVGATNFATARPNSQSGFLSLAGGDSRGN
jgi:hypothetical protein